MRPDICEKVHIEGSAFEDELAELLAAEQNGLIHPDKVQRMKDDLLNAIEDATHPSVYSPLEPETITVLKPGMILNTPNLKRRI